ncbi:MAG: BatD family protein, partial [Dehalococcoidia bacterium]
AGIRRMLLAAAGVLLVVLAWTSLVSAQSPVTMEATLDRNVVTVGDRITVSVTLTLPESAQADLTTLESQFGDLELLVVGLPHDIILPDGRRQVTATYEVAAFRTGTVELPALSMLVQLADGSNSTATTAPLPVNVESVIPPGENPTDVRDLKPQISYPVVSGLSTRRVALAVAAVALTLAAILLLIRWLRRPRGEVLPLPAPPPSPEIAARTELERISRLGLLERGDIKQFHALLAACIRRYLTVKYHFPAFAMTTTELKRSMTDLGVDRWQARLVGGLLTESDAVNFAQYVPARARCEQNLEMAYQIVDAADPAIEQPAAVAAATA